MQRPRPRAAQNERRAELILAAHRVPEVPERTVERINLVRRAGVHHPRQRVVPRILQRRRPLPLAIPVRPHHVARMRTSHPRRLHPPRRRQIRRPQTHPLQPRTRRRNRLHIRDPLRRLQNRVNQDRPLQTVPRLQLRQQQIQEANLLRAVDLGQHHRVQHIADLLGQLQHVVQEPWRVDRVDPRPQPRAAQLQRLPHFDQPAPRRLLRIGRNRVLQIAQQNVHLRRELGQPRPNPLVARVEKVNHPRGVGRNLGRWIGRADHQRAQKFAGIAHRSLLASGPLTRRTAPPQRARSRPAA